MITVTTRQLKQNPAAAIRDVLDAGEPAVVTAHGAPTGVVLAPERPKRHTWVSGRDVTVAFAASPLGADEVRTWQDDLASSRELGFGRDLWSADE